MDKQEAALSSTTDIRTMSETCFSCCHYSKQFWKSKKFDIKGNIKDNGIESETLFFRLYCLLWANVRLLCFAFVLFNHLLLSSFSLHWFQNSTNSSHFWFFHFQAVNGSFRLSTFRPFSFDKGLFFQFRWQYQMALIPSHCTLTFLVDLNHCKTKSKTSFLSFLSFSSKTLKRNH